MSYLQLAIAIETLRMCELRLGMISDRSKQISLAAELSHREGTINLATRGKVEKNKSRNIEM